MTIVSAVAPIARDRVRVFALAGLAWLGVAVLPPTALANHPEPPRLERDSERVPLGASLMFLEDPAHALDIAAVAALPRERFRHAGNVRGDVNFGYSNSRYWFAITLNSRPDAPRDWLLEIAFPSLDAITVHVPRAGGGFSPVSAGDLRPFAERPVAHRHFVFPVALPPGATHTLYLEVSSRGSLTVPVTLWRPEALAAQDRTSYSALALYYGMLLALGIYNLLLGIATRERVFLAYVAFTASLAVGMGSFNGLANQFVWPEWPAWGNVALPVGMSLTGLSGAVFTRLFLGTHLRFPRLDRAMLGFMIAFAASALLSMVAYPAGALLTSATGFGFALTAVAAGIHCMRQRQPGACWFLLAWTLLLAGVAVLALRNLGWVPTSALTLNGMQIGSALEMLLLSFALADRINVMRRDKERADQEVRAAREQALAIVQRHEQELEARVAERTRDLVQANQKLRDNERNLEHLARHDPLTGLANRTLLEDRLALAIARTRRSGRGCAVLLIDLDGFKSVNDTRGHAAGDEVLRQLATRIRACVRETDTVARLGGDEFVVLLEDLGGESDAGAVAEKLVAEAVRPFDVSTGLAWIGASIGIAHCPKDGTETELLLRRADSAMYAVKQSGKKGWKNFSL